MNEEEFWGTQPIRLNALLRVHNELNNTNGTGTSKTSRTGYIDQVL